LKKGNFTKDIQMEAGSSILWGNRVNGKTTPSKKGEHPNTGWEITSRLFRGGNAARVQIPDGPIAITSGGLMESGKGIMQRGTETVASWGFIGGGG